MIFVTGDTHGSLDIKKLNTAMKWKPIKETLAEKYTNIDTSNHIWQQLVKKTNNIGIGWHDLIIELFMKIEKIYEDNNIDIEEFRLDHIKEKYASLRIDGSSSIEEVHELISELEYKSLSVCEECGKEGSLHRNKTGYLFTVCDECALVKGFEKVGGGSKLAKWKLIGETIAEKYPHIDTSKHIWHELVNTGTEYGPGWNDLIIELFTKIEEIYEKNNVDVAEFRVDQIREKYARLDVWLHSSLPEVNKLIQEYEDKSETICDSCGKEGMLHVDQTGYFLIMCDNCALKEGFEKVNKVGSIESEKNSITLKVKVLKDTIQLGLEDALLEIDRHPFYSEVKGAVYLGNGHINFFTNNDIEPLYLKVLIMDKYPLSIKTNYRNLGKQYTDEELLDLISKIGWMEWSIDDQG